MTGCNDGGCADTSCRTAWDRIFVSNVVICVDVLVLSAYKKDVKEP